MMYGQYAAVYDGSGQVRYALLAAAYFHTLFQRHPLVGQRMIDIACGTGTLALHFAGEGWEVLGVDLAPAMLAQAEAKAANAVLPGRVSFQPADMRHLAELLPPAQFDLATCIYDSLNYMLNEADLLASFRAAAYVVRAGGLYICDLNTRYFLEQVWGEHEIHEQAGYIQIEQSHFDPERALMTMHLSGFIGDDQHGYTRFDETHQERAYPESVVNDLLHQAGFLVEGCYDSFTHHPPNPASHRLFWVARRIGTTPE